MKKHQVVCTVGAPEDQVLNASAPRKIDGEGTIALIEASEAAGVSQFVLVTSLGTGKIGWPASASIGACRSMPWDNGAH